MTVRQSQSRSIKWLWLLLSLLSRNGLIMVSTSTSSSSLTMLVEDHNWNAIVSAYSSAPGHKLSVADSMAYESEVNQRITRGEWPLEAWEAYQIVAAQSGNVDSAALLLKYGVPHGEAVAETSTETAKKKKMKNRKNIDVPKGLIKSEEQARTLSKVILPPAIYQKVGVVPETLQASYRRDPQSMALILEDTKNLAQLEASGLNGLTALQVAASLNDVETLDVLYRHGADVNARHPFADSTALHFAVEMNAVQAVESLCEHDAAIDAQKIDGGQPIHIAADLCHAQALEALLSPPCSADKDAIMLGDTTPLYLGMCA